MSYKDTFLEKALELHGDKYDYSSVDYVNSKLKIIIICKKHGEFLQTPNCHLMGQGCPLCALDNKRDRAEANRLTTEEFITRAKNIHGDLYDYSMVDYKSYHNKVTICCSKHGKFEQTPASHLGGRGCIKCYHNKFAKDQTLTEDVVFNIAKTKFPSYDFSESCYKGRNSTTKVICPNHGVIYMSWKYILYSKNVDACTACKSISDKKDYFIKESCVVHNNKYSYDLVGTYKNNEVVDIVCPIHGVFQQKPSNHLRGRGCQLCGGTSNSGTSGFISKAKEKHGDTYDYSLVNYINRRTPVDIVCKEHGVFSITPMTHLRADIGYPRCSRAAAGDTRKLTQEDFLEKMKRHENLDLSNVTYTKAHDSVDVKCKEHGEFKTKFITLLYGSQPCKACRKYNYTYNSDSIGYFYINAIFTKDENIYLKFGVSYDPEKRFKFFMKKNRRSLKDLVTLDIFEFDTLHEAYLFEKYVKDNLTYTQIFNKERMRDGFTEICEASLYNNILQLRRDFV